jgi:nucleoid-associated protein YgaU
VNRSLKFAKLFMAVAFLAPLLLASCASESTNKGDMAGELSSAAADASSDDGDKASNQEATDGASAKADDAATSDDDASDVGSATDNAAAEVDSDTKAATASAAPLMEEGAAAKKELAVNDTKADTQPSADSKNEDKSSVTDLNASTAASAPVAADAVKSDTVSPADNSAVADATPAPAPAPSNEEMIAGDTQAAPVVHKKVSHKHFAASKPVADRKIASASDVNSHEATPELPGLPVMVSGSNLNRYYFVRSGDTAEKISNRLYGTSNMLMDLALWNGPKESWTTGKVLLYSSSSNAQDTQMHSYFDDQKLAFENHVLQKGENLETIAKARYGSADSWKEIAAINGIRFKQDSKAGVKIKLYPTTLPEKPAVEQAKIIPPIPASKPGMAQAVPVAPEVMPKSEVKPQLANPEVGGVLKQHHLLLAALLAAASIGMFVVMIIRRRKSNEIHEFHD